MTTPTATLAHITGRVQGVGFRFWTLEEAEALGLAGWVRNEPDGSVTALLIGPEGAVSEMIRKLHAGPPGAAVAGVALDAVDAGDTQDGFRILR
ncbi:acylphosphatase [Mesorhizobium sp. IMUNJ 23232]|uniref:acylphosphatase n=1 Tax=Mesorhizobium sp. IMUNJ 23232 TaxID=3376064 RepID=UPI00379C4BF8